MPSLDALGEFKSSFSNIGNERADLISKKLNYDDLALPDTEAPPMDLTRMAAPGTQSDEISADTEPGSDGFDFNAFINTNPAPSLDEPPSIDDLMMNDLYQTESAGAGEQALDDFLKDLNIQTEPSNENTFVEDTPDPFSAPADDFSAEELPGSVQAETPVDLDEFALDDFDPGDTSSPEKTTSDDFEGIDMGGESPHLEGIDMGGESPHFEENPAKNDDFGSGSSDTEADETNEFADDAGIDMGGETLDFETGSDDSLPDFETPLPNDDFAGFESGTDSAGSDDFSLPDDFSAGAADDPGAPDLGAGEQSLPDDFSQNFDGDFGSDFSSDSIELDNEPETQSQGNDSSSSAGFDSGGFDNDDFQIPGLEEIFDKTKSGAAPPPAEKKGFFKKRKDKKDDVPEAESDVEEIRLSENDVSRLLKTLASYPLNLRVVCEEMIAEMVLLPQQLSKLIRMLINGANVRDTAAFAEEITGKHIVIPKSFEKMTGAAFEAEQASFAYIFVHNFLPVLRLFAVIALLAASVIYLGYRFIYIPVKAEGLYKRGYERIPEGEYQRANQLFNEAFLTHKKKKWFYSYAEAFRDQRRYSLAEEKYDELLFNYPRDKKGVLDYANLQTYYLLNYEKANRLLQQQLLDYAPNDYDGLLAAGDNFLLWADSDPSRFYDRYEDARFSYARLIELNGWLAPIIERMMKYFIRTDNLKEVLTIRVWFENDVKRKLSAPSLAELGGYLLDKQLTPVKGVPDPYLESIESVRNMLLQAVREEPTLPEPHYHLARYHNSLGNTYEERLTLENAIRAFDLAQTESVRRRLNRVDTHFRYSNLLVNNREFFPAEEQVIKGIQLYEDFLARNLITASASPQLGQLYAAKGDLEYFVKSGDMNAALSNYRQAERYGYMPPEIQYRMGAAFYHLQDWRNSLDYLFKASAGLPLNRKLLYALGNAAYQRGDYFAAEGYYSRLLDILDSQRVRMPVLLPNDNPQFLELGERLMMAYNNAGVIYEALAEQTGRRDYRSSALGLYAESARAWDSITRNPETMVRMRLTDLPGAPGINLGFLNANNAIRPTPNYVPQIFVRIDKDVLDPSKWEELAPFGGLR
ncbi:MAG: tetratricopeptide repeat protein [Treponema sp.]|nr:tetratricopeptide repeat protein [Treponema sp.]